MSANLDILEEVANRLGPLKNKVVFVGGAVTELLVTEAGSREPRATADVDAILEVTTIVQYYDLADQLRGLGFVEDRGEDARKCRWKIGAIKVDLMPPDENILGFSNRWYRDTFHNAQRIVLPFGTEVRVATSPFFIATKLEAFAGRGNGDYQASHDLEDIITVVDGRPELADEVGTAEADLRTYLGERIGALINADAFLNAITGHLPADDASQQRAPLVLRRLEEIASRCARK